jgi:hypothetical protein
MFKQVGLCSFRREMAPILAVLLLGFLQLASLVLIFSKVQLGRPVRYNPETIFVYLSVSSSKDRCVQLWMS